MALKDLGLTRLLCIRFGLEFANLEPQGKREVLVSVRNAACAMMERVDRSLSQMLQPQEKRQDAPQR